MANEFTHIEQNYIKAIYHLARKSEGTAYTLEIAEAMSTTGASATDMMKKLSEKGVLTYVPYRGASLNKKGEKTALSIIRRHRLWELFLVEIVKFKWDEVHAMAEELEHVDNAQLLDRIDQLLGHPKFDPHGDPIPDASGKIPDLNFVLLTALTKGQAGLVAGVNEHSGSFLKYLEDTGLTLGNSVKLIAQHDFDKSIDLVLNGKKNLHVSNDVAKNILIKLK